MKIKREDLVKVEKLISEVLDNNHDKIIDITGVFNIKPVNRVDKWFVVFYNKEQFHELNSYYIKGWSTPVSYNGKNGYIFDVNYPEFENNWMAGSPKEYIKEGFKEITIEEWRRNYKE